MFFLMVRSNLFVIFYSHKKAHTFATFQQQLLDGTESVSIRVCYWKQCKRRSSEKGRDSCKRREMVDPKDQ